MLSPGLLEEVRFLLRLDRGNRFFRTLQILDLTGAKFRVVELERGFRNQRPTDTVKTGAGRIAVFLIH